MSKKCKWIARGGIARVQSRNEDEVTIMRWRNWFVAALVLLSTGPAASAQSVADDLAVVERRFAAARESAVHLLAPRAFKQAVDRLRDAQRRADRGSDASAIRERLDQARSEIGLAELAADDVRISFSDALRAREGARGQDAALRAPSAWESAERELERAGRDAERGKLADAAEPAGRATELYRRAAEAARSDRLLGEAIDARQAALSGGGSQLAPGTFALGEEALAAGQAAIASGSDAEVGRDGERALDAFRRAGWLAALADSVISRAISLETFVNDHERDLALLAEAAGVEPPDLRTREGSATAAIERAIRDVLARNADLDDALRAERATTGQLSGQVASLEEALTDSERRYSDSRASLLARQRQDDRLRETSALFSPEEGEIFLSGDDLVLRLYGLTFASGSDEVDDSMAPLLTKVERVLLEFSDATIRVEGHTDSQGNADRNRALSQSRAIAIRDYLLSRVPISSSRMEATGHGEDRPIARNDTEEGRARNRRIEIILTLPN
ncbi:MAG: OmpA family protein [Gemmatimonadota bacterium]